MTKDIYCIETSKEALKFSAAHVATFADGEVERLHGHNYHVSARLRGELDAAGMVLDVGVLKTWVKELCAELDEAVLIAMRNPAVKVEQADGAVRMEVKGKVYVLPEEDCRLLNIENTTMEYLAHYLTWRLRERMLEAAGDAARMVELTVSVSETRGQSASWTLGIGQ